MSNLRRIKGHQTRLLWIFYPTFLGVTKEMMPRGPQVADIEYREADEKMEAPILPHVTI
jgi:hypothetical protein